MQGDSLCPKLFTIHLNPLAWTLRTTDGYTLSKPIDHKITQLLFIDDMKIVVPNEKKLCPTLKVERRASKDLNLDWDQYKCAAMNVKRGHPQAEELRGETGRQHTTYAVFVKSNRTRSWEYRSTSNKILRQRDRERPNNSCKACGQYGYQRY